MKRALLRLVVALLNLLATLVELALRLVQLAVAWVEHFTPKPSKAVRELAPTVVDDDAAERFSRTLIGMGFPRGPVRAFTASVRPRLNKEPVEVLVREGIVRLSS
jgi:hypothetical protein